MTKVQMEERITVLEGKLDIAETQKKLAQDAMKEAQAELKVEQVKNGNLKAVLKDLLANEPDLET